MTKKRENVIPLRKGADIVTLPTGEKVEMIPAGDTPEDTQKITSLCNAMLRLLMNHCSPDEAGTVVLNTLGGILTNACTDGKHFEESLVAVHRDLEMIARAAWKDRQGRRGH